MKIVHISATLAAAAVLVAGCGTATPETRASTATQDGGDSCGAFVGGIDEVSEFTPFELQRGAPGGDVLINPEGARSDKVPEGLDIAEVGGIPRQWATLPGGEVYQFYSQDPITSKTTIGEFREGNGLSVEITPVQNLSVSDISKQLGSRAAPVSIGNYRGVVVWADPTDDSGRRLHHVYWETGDYLFGLLVEDDASAAVTLARTIACR